MAVARRYDVQINHDVLVGLQGLLGEDFLCGFPRSIALATSNRLVELAQAAITVDIIAGVAQARNIFVCLDFETLQDKRGFQPGPVQAGHMHSLLQVGAKNFNYVGHLSLILAPISPPKTIRYGSHCNVSSALANRACSRQSVPPHTPTRKTMHQLSALDYAFVQQESTRSPMHISPIIIYDQSGVKRGPVRFKEILTVFERSLHKSAIFRRKLAGGAMGFDTPYWVEDPNFDLEFHVRHISLPKPGDWRQFCILLARLHARGLDMKRPLWEAYVIEGLNNVEDLPENSFAIMLKVHHSAIDGVSGAEIVTAIHSLTDEVAPPLVEDSWTGEDDPSIRQTWSQAYLNNLKRPQKFFDTARELVPAVLRANRLKQSDDEAEPKTPTARTRFNRKIGSHRVTDTIFLDLAEVKRIKAAIEGGTVNDVVVSVVGGALRKYLQANEELPDGSLSCGAPINVRQERDSESTGNQVSMMRISLATDIEDPVKRMMAVNQSARKSKAYSSAVGAGVLMDVTQSLSPQLVGMGLRAATTAIMRTDMALPIQTIVSNVPGPQFDLYMAGAKVRSIMGMGPVLDMMGLFHAVISASGTICINFVACRDLLPDPEFYRSCLQEAYDELKSASLGKGRGKKKGRK